MKELSKFLVASLIGGLVVVLGLSLLQPQKTSVGGQTGTDFNTKGALSASTTVTASTGFYDDGTLLIQGDGAFIGTARGTVNTTSSITLGASGTSLEAVVCDTTVVNIGVIAGATTSSVPFDALTGISTSTNQVWLWGLATTTPHFRNVTALALIGSSTADAADLIIENRGTGATPAGTSTWRACFLQF